MHAFIFHQARDSYAYFLMIEFLFELTEAKKDSEFIDGLHT